RRCAGRRRAPGRSRRAVPPRSLSSRNLRRFQPGRLELVALLRELAELGVEPCDGLVVRGLLRDLLVQLGLLLGNLRKTTLDTGDLLLRSTDVALRDGPLGIPRRVPRSAGGSRGRHRRAARSEEHTSELQSRENLVCRR